MFQLTVNDTPYKKKPSHSQVGIIKSRLETREFLSIYDFSEFIKSGRSFQLAVFDDNKADREHWKFQQLFALDFDNKDVDLKRAGLTSPVLPEHVQRACMKYGLHPNITYYTFSNSIELPKFRVVFILEHPITDKDSAIFISNQLTRMFPACDIASTKDIARLYFGTTETGIQDASSPLNKTDTFFSIFANQSINDNSGNKRYLPKNYTREVETELRVVKNFDFQEAARRVRILREFLNGEWLYYQQLFGVVCNLASIEGGLALAQKVIDMNPHYDNNARQVVRNVRKYKYHPMRLAEFSPYPEDHQYYNIVSSITETRHITMIKKSTTEKLPLSAAEAHMNRFLTQFTEASVVEADEDENYKGDNLYILAVPTGIGKTTQLRKRFAGSKVVIATPYHTLIEEFYNALDPNIRRDCVVTPALPEFSNALQEHINRLYALKLPTAVHALLSDVVSGRKPKNYNGVVTAQDKKLAYKFRDELSNAYRLDNKTVLTTHHRAVYTEFQHTDTIIFDEDPIMELYKNGSYDGNNLHLLIQEGGAFGQEAQALYNKFRCSVGVEPTPIPLYLEKEKLLEWFANGEHTKGAEIMEFVNSSFFTVDKANRNPDDLCVQYITANHLPHNKKVLICSATANIELYKLRYPRAKILDITRVELAGTQIQHLDINSSQQAIKRNLDDYKTLVGDSPVITFRNLKQNFPNAVDTVYAFKAEGTDTLKGSECVVLATPRRPSWFYLLRAFAFGVKGLQWADIYGESVQIITWNDVEFKFYTFAHKALQVIQLADIEAQLIQLTGRMRALRDPEALVHLCSHLPVRNFDYDLTKRKNLPTFTLSVKEPELRDFERVENLPDLVTHVSQISDAITSHYDADGNFLYATDDSTIY